MMNSQPWFLAFFPPIFTLNFFQNQTRFSSVFLRHFVEKLKKNKQIIQENYFLNIFTLKTRFFTNKY